MVVVAATVVADVPIAAVVAVVIDEIAVAAVLAATVVVVIVAVVAVIAIVAAVVYNLVEAVSSSAAVVVAVPPPVRHPAGKEGVTAFCTFIATCCHSLRPLGAWPDLTGPHYFFSMLFVAGVVTPGSSGALFCQVPCSTTGLAVVLRAFHNY